MATLFFLWLLILFPFNKSTRGEWGQIKINEPRASYSSNNNNNYNSNTDTNTNSNTADSSSYREPHSETENSEIVIPSVLQYLVSRKEEHIEGTHDKYTFKLFLFDKVEQSENWYVWNLGIFDKWDYCDSATQNELCLLFTDGQVCGNGVGRSSHVHFVCDSGDRDVTKEHLFDISEPSTCAYHMNVYIPRICDLVSHDITQLFAANSNGEIGEGTPAQIQAQSGTVGESVGMIGDSSALMHTLNGIMTAQNKEKELDKLWKLCLMSLLVDDNGKLSKIRSVASLFMETNVASEDIESEQTEICDFYLEQMLNEKKKETVTDAPMETVKDTGLEIVDVGNGNEEHSLAEDVGIVEENEGSDFVGLIGGPLSEDIIDNESEVVFQSGTANHQNEVVDNDSEIVFQSGNDQNEYNDIIIDEELFDEEIDFDTDHGL